MTGDRLYGAGDLAGPGWRRIGPDRDLYLETGAGLMPMLEAGRGPDAVVPYLRTALDAVNAAVDAQLPAAAAGDPDAIAAVAAGIDHAGRLLGFAGIERPVAARRASYPPTYAPDGREIVNVTASAAGAQLVRARVYRTDGDPEDPEVGPCWHWRCEGCRMQSSGCLHTVLHEPGTWRAAMCGGLHHVHTEHERRPAVQGEHPHTVLGGRRRCDWTPPSEHQLRFAALVLCGRTGYPRGHLAREIAREVLALAGRRAP